ncbi:hypothetical protein [Borrelia sp. P9F1]|uniref:hypothetical protein n=1 Tax=Borrelia sp. P9F1 TaxID=3058374 RepID=UPI002647E6A7|nr:hypothetical protein [Borrelia sp. P9F1]WKC58263.1 hypothetical protein QYZ68_03750 [Borrelia sp. P9F1]
MNKMVNGVLALLAFAILSCDLLNQVGSGASGGSVSVKENEESDRKGNEESDGKDVKTNKKDKVVGEKKKVDVVANGNQELQNAPKGNKQGGGPESNPNPTLGVPGADDDESEDEFGFGYSKDDFVVANDPPQKEEEKEQGEFVGPFERVADGGSFRVTEDLYGPDTTKTEKEN